MTLKYKLNSPSTKIFDAFALTPGSEIYTSMEDIMMLVWCGMMNSARRTCSHSSHYSHKNLISKHQSTNHHP